MKNQLQTNEKKLKNVEKAIRKEYRFQRQSFEKYGLEYGEHTVSQEELRKRTESANKLAKLNRQAQILSAKIRKL